MRLQDLKDDLAEWAKTNDDADSDGRHRSAALTVARWVAELFEVCPMCWDGSHGPGEICPNCLGSGVQGSDKAEALMEAEGLSPRDWTEAWAVLARYLFGEDTE